MTEEQIKKCKELSAQLDELIDFRNYVVGYKNDVWWKVVSASDTYSTIKSETDKGVKIPHCLRDILISNAERMIDITEESLREL